MASKESYFEIYEDAKGEFRWRLHSANGEAVATGEGYESKSGAMSAAKKLKEWASTTDMREVA